MSNAYKSVLSIIVVAFLVSSIMGVSYSYFTSNLAGEEVASTIVLTNGKMIITYANNDKSLTLNNVKASNEAVISKKFAISGHNNSDSNMNYMVYLKVNKNTFNDNSLTCSIIGRSLTKNQNMINANNMIIPKSGELNIGSAYFNGKSETIHEYELNVYYKNGTNKNNFDGEIIVRSDEA